MLCNHLFEDAESDLRSVRLAQKWAFEFFHWMEQRNTDVPLGEINELNFMQPTIKDVGKLDLFYVSGWRLGLPDDLSFGIAWMSDGSTTSARARMVPAIQENKMHYFVLLMANSDLRQQTDVMWQLNANSLVHEITHYFEYKRGYNAALYWQRHRAAKRERDGMPPIPQKKRTLRNYYNAPLELNSHFQQAFADMFIGLASRLAQQKQYGIADEIPWLDSFRAFYAQFRKVADQQKYQYLQSLSGPNRQKLIRRLYKLYTLIKQRWPNLAEIRQQADEFVERWQAADQKDAA